MGIATNKVFDRVIQEAYSHITEMLDVCELGKNEMKSLPCGELGSWQLVVTRSDGCWHVMQGFLFLKLYHGNLQLANCCTIMVCPCLHEGCGSNY